MTRKHYMVIRIRLTERWLCDETALRTALAACGWIADIDGPRHHGGTMREWGDPSDFTHVFEQTLYRKDA